MNTTKLKLVRLMDGTDRLDAVDVLREYAKLDTDSALKAVSKVSTGGATIEVSANISTGAVRNIRRYFELIVQHSGMATTKIPELQLKLWHVAYSFVGGGPRRAALVLAETDTAAIGAVNAKKRRSNVVAKEVEGPFNDGQILMTRTI